MQMLSSSICFNEVYRCCELFPLNTDQLVENFHTIKSLERRAKLFLWIEKCADHFNVSIELLYRIYAIFDIFLSENNISPPKWQLLSLCIMKKCWNLSFNDLVLLCKNLYTKEEMVGCFEQLNDFIMGRRIFSHYDCLVSFFANSSIDIALFNKLVFALRLSLLTGLNISYQIIPFISSLVSYIFMKESIMNYQFKALLKPSNPIFDMMPEILNQIEKKFNPIYSVHFQNSSHVC
eukprot:TRINITY_DN13968_c0_g1_i1.p1 TRINITY_DN13968_c0_g1~~TRINITY_DN13968_c0_g1_i1.p1  ORF type:complete len:235 (-),score=52.18 TRINITY_DN13968_c0_g1_i1:11-715(-)